MSNTATSLPEPGSIVHRDYRAPGALPRPGRTIKLLQWNIERGYQLPGIVEELRRIDADVISLQEVDALCDRSGGVDTGAAIAEALQLNYLFFCEFEELHSPLRDARSQGGGVHGNAILTKFDLSDWGLVEHRLHPVDWNNPEHPLAKKEPRRGRRAVLRATVETPQGPLVVYCAHLEVFCGMLARVCQLADVFADARRMVQQGLFHQALLGDLNTMAHGIARLSPNYCRDQMRYRSLGMDEAVVWERFVISAADPSFDPALDGQWAQSAPAPAAAAAALRQRQAGLGAAAGGGQAAASEGGHAAAAAAQQEHAAAQQDAAAEAAMLAEELAEDQAAAPAAAIGEPPLNPADAPTAEGAGTAAAALGVPVDAACAGPLGAGAAAAASAAADQAGRGPLNSQLLKWGLSEETARDALNPGFADPFPAATTVTLDNPAYRWFGVSLMRGKLDWALLRRLRVHATSIGNHSYQLSDHKWLAVEVSLNG